MKMCFAIMAVLCSCPVVSCQSAAILNLSHDSTVKILSQAEGVSGTGFIVGDNYVLTCFHVIGSAIQEGPTLNWKVFPDIQVIFPTGEIIPGIVVSLPNDVDTSPLINDFAFVKLSHPPTNPVVKVQLANADEDPKLGDDVAFSGFPLSTPGMVTHRGMVSGADPTNTLIFIEASINKGNSGGALINSRGHVIGIVSMREGGISSALDQLRTQINANAAHATVQLMGVDPLAATNAIINTLDQYISTGIGYARTIKYAREYQSRHPTLAK